MQSKDERTESHNHEGSKKEERKLELEIKSLEKKNKWETKAQVMPLITTFVGAAAFFFTIVQFQCQRATEQQKDRITREVDQTTKFQNQMRGDIEEVLKFPRDKNQTVSKVAFLLEDVNTVMRSKVNDSQRVSDVFPQYGRSLTRSLVSMLIDDCDFAKNPREIGLANAVIEHWCDYSDYLSGNSDALRKIVYQYINALRGIHDNNRGFLEQLELDEKTDRYLADPEYEPGLISEFREVKDGFKNHLNLWVAQDPADQAKRLRDQSVTDFRAALCNKKISKDVFGVLPDEVQCEDYPSARAKGRQRPRHHDN